MADYIELNIEPKDYFHKDTVLTLVLTNFVNLFFSKIPYRDINDKSVCQIACNLKSAEDFDTYSIYYQTEYG